MTKTAAAAYELLARYMSLSETEIASHLGITVIEACDAMCELLAREDVVEYRGGIMRLGV